MYYTNKLFITYMYSTCQCHIWPPLIKICFIYDVTACKETKQSGVTVELYTMWRLLFMNMHCEVYIYGSYIKYLLLDIVLIS